LISCFPGMLFRYFLNAFEMVPFAPIITGITLVFTFHLSCISIVRALYFRIFSAAVLTTFLSPTIVACVNVRFHFSLSGIIMSGLLLQMFLSVFTCWFRNVATLFSWFVSADFDAYACQCLYCYYDYYNCDYYYYYCCCYYYYRDTCER
jgi:hypothetical protein